MKKATKITIICLTAGVGTIFFVSVFSASPDGGPISISYQKQISPDKTSFTISNSWNAAIRLDPYATLYFTNMSGNAEHTFVLHNSGYAVIKPGLSQSVAVKTPHSTGDWKVSFSYQVRRPLITRWLEMMFFKFGGRLPTETFHMASSEAVKIHQDSEQKPNLIMNVQREGSSLTSDTPPQ
jgi:hypothetical protein